MSAGILTAPPTRLHPERGYGIAFVGDSLTNFWFPFSQMWHNALCAQSGGYIRHRGKFALGAQTLAQMESTYLPAALAIHPKPGAVVLGGGTNDHSAASYTLADSAATLNRMINTCLAVGVLPILWLVPPRQDSVTYNTRVSQWNVYVRQLAATLGLPFIDFHTPLVDPTTGLTAVAYQGDTVHPNIAGHQVAAAYNLARPQFLSRVADCTPHLVHDVLDPTNLFAGGIGLFSAMSGSWPTGFTGTAPATASLVTDSQAVGNWVRLSVASGSTGTSLLNPSTNPTVSPGDKIAMACRFRHNYPQSVNTGTAGLQLTLYALDGSNASLASNIIYGPIFGNYSGVAYGELVAPAGTVKVKPEIRIVGTPTADATVDIAQYTLLNLTALGLASLTTTDFL